MTWQRLRPHRHRRADIVGACERVREYGGKVTREPGPVKHGTTVIADSSKTHGWSSLIERLI